MYHLIEGSSINFPGLMLVLIREAAGKVKVCLPYGMVLTLVFGVFNVSLEMESFKKLQSYDEYYNWTLHRMGHQKVKGH